MLDNDRDASDPSRDCEEVRDVARDVAVELAVEAGGVTELVLAMTELLTDVASLKLDSAEALKVGVESA